MLAASLDDDVASRVRRGEDALADELAREPTPERRMQLRAERFNSLTSGVLADGDDAPRRAAIDELRSRVLGSAEARADAEAVDRAAARRGEGYRPTAGDLEIAERHRREHGTEGEIAP